MKNLADKTEREKSFYLHGGKEIYNVPELLGQVYTMNDETFNHHVTPDKNDFANWICHVFENKSLAKKIEKALTREKIILVLEEALCEKGKSQINKFTATKKKATSKKK